MFFRVKGVTPRATLSRMTVALSGWLFIRNLHVPPA
jgi:hypothetical protein